MSKTDAAYMRKYRARKREESRKLGIKSKSKGMTKHFEKVRTPEEMEVFMARAYEILRDPIAFWEKELEWNI